MLAKRQRIENYEAMSADIPPQEDEHDGGKPERKYVGYHVTDLIVKHRTRRHPEGWTAKTIHAFRQAYASLIRRIGLNSD